MENKIDLQVGDRVTYRIIKTNEILTLIIDGSSLLEDLKDKKHIEILKIERPKYEVVEEKKELLTEEEKKFLEQILKFMDIKILSISISKKIISEKKEIHFNQNRDSSGLGYWYYIKNNTFNGLETDKVYTLEELGLD